MPQVSKALLTECYAARRKKKPLKALSLEHMNNDRPVIPTVLDSSVLRNIGLQVNIFCLRERDLLERLAQEVSSLLSEGKTETIAFNMVHILAEDLGKAYSQRRVLDSILAVERNVADRSTKETLRLLRTLYALVTIEENISFLRHGFLTSQQAQFIQKEVSRLCKEIRPHALSLVNSLGIPQEYLSPIAFNWIEANSWEEVVRSS